MPQPPRVLRPWAGIREFFGAEVRHWRLAKGLSQDEVGSLLHVSGDTIAKIEKAERWPPPGFADSCDRALSTGGILTRLVPLLEHQKASQVVRSDRSAPPRQPGSRPPLTEDVDEHPWEADTRAAALETPPGESETIMVRLSPDGQVFAMIGRRTFLVSGLASAALGPPAHATHSRAEVSTLAETARVSWPGARVLPTAAGSAGGEADLLLPGGVAFDGAMMPLRLAEARLSGSGHISLADMQTRSRARLVVGALDAGDTVRYFALDDSSARCGAQSSKGPPRRIPQAYELDDLTYAALWASTNLERALLEDDAVLDEACRSMRSVSWETGSEAAHEQTIGLGATSQMWLGSSFCAQHILHHLAQRPTPPVFWTREQRGEEASTWLFFRHKQDYLRTISHRYRQAGRAAAVRIFCIPEDVVTQTRRPERILLLLAVAQMEAQGIRVVVTVDPAHAGNPGFLLGGGGRALVATWVREAKAWQVDPTPGTAHERDFADAVRHSLSVSILSASTSSGRLEQFAHFLGLDWRWLRQRAGQLADTGWDGLIRPRSRLLSASGLDIACRHLATT